MWKLADGRRSSGKERSRFHELSERSAEETAEVAKARRDAARLCLQKENSPKISDTVVPKILRRNRETDDAQRVDRAKPAVKRSVQTNAQKQHVSAHVTPVCESSKCTTQKEQVRELSSFPREPDGDLGLYNAFECRTGKGQPGRSAFKLVDCWRNARLDGHVQQMANLARRRLLGSQENRKVSEEPEIGRRGVTTALQLSCPSRTSSCPRGTRARCTGVAVCDF